MNEENVRFLNLRRKLFGAIGKELAADDVCLPDEGALEIRYVFPNYFDFTYDEPTDTPCGVEIVLNCYVFGSSKRHRWRAKTLKEALDKFEHSIEEWIENDR